MYTFKIETVKDMDNNYTPKGDLKGLPIEVIKQMLIEQVAQGNPENIEVFERDKCATKAEGGFNWADSELGSKRWCNVIDYKNFTDFYKMYPKDESKNIIKEAMRITSKDVREPLCVRKGLVTKSTKHYPKKMLVWDKDEDFAKERLIIGEFDGKFFSKGIVNNRCYYAWNFAKDIEEND